MKTSKRTPIIAALMIGAIIGSVSLSVATASRESTGPAIPMTFSALAEKARPGVVNIRTVKTTNGGGPVFRHFFGNPFGRRHPFDEFFGPFSENEPSRKFKQRSLGSGFIIDRDGYIVTNNHVIERADEIIVKLADGEEYKASMVGTDPKTDLALIKIDPSRKLPPLKLGNSDALKIGGWVVAIGSPFGLEQTVTAGIVSAKGRVIGAGPYDDFIQTDASINPGNSGGPLLNLSGEVVGINTAIIASGQGIGFAIPIDLAKHIISQLKNKGEVTRGWLGVGIQDIDENLSDYYGIERRRGALVTRVMPGDPADAAGIKTGDVIISVNGTSITSGRDLSATIANLPVGDKTKIEVIRKGKSRTFEVTLAKRDDTRPSTVHSMNNGGDLGIRLEKLTPESARRFGFDGGETGVLVSAVRPAGQGEKAGIRSGDLIKEVNRHPVASPDEFQNQMAQVKKKESLQLLILRPNMGYFVVRIDR